MIVKVNKSSHFSQFSDLLMEVHDNPEVNSIMILGCDSNDIRKPETDRLLKSLKKPVFGGLFPAIIYEKEKLDSGNIILGIKEHVNTLVINNISDELSDFEERLESFEFDYKNTRTMFVFVDGFSTRISALIDNLFTVFGLEFNYIGGGAGSLSMQQSACIFSNQGLLQDAAILAASVLKSGVGVSHGWKSISETMRVTSSNKNIIEQLDFKIAFDKYKEVIYRHSAKEITKDNFFEIAKAYPFGINKLDAERIVRDPLTTKDEKNLICVGEVPSGVFVNILHGNENSLIKAAKNALEIAESTYPDKNKDAFTFFIDCISRVLFLDENFSKEINAVYNYNHPLIGALTIGEIANNGDDYLEFYNKTAVVGIIEKK